MIRDPDDFDPVAFEAQLATVDDLPAPRSKAIRSFSLAMWKLSEFDQRTLLMSIAAQFGFAITPLSGLPEDCGSTIALLRDIHAKAKEIKARHAAEDQKANADDAPAA